MIPISTGKPFPPLMKSADQAEDHLLKTALDGAAEQRKVLREALIRIAPPPRVINVGQGGAGPAPRARKGQASLAPSAGNDLVTNPKCVVAYDSLAKKTTLLATATVKAPLTSMALMVDPRSWGFGGTVIGASFIVSSNAGMYAPARELGKAALGKSWKRGRAQLLYEYARSEFASFENILKITRFTSNTREVRAEYELHECLVFMLSLLSTPGGLTMNQGHVIATRSASDENLTDIEVLKEIRVRDLTPNDPGNPYDFGQAVNSTMGAALSSWIDDARFLHPVF